MEKNNKILLEIESIQRLIDTILKLSTALLLVPMVFLKFVATVGPKAHPDAFLAVYEVSWWMKCGIFLPLGSSLVTGLITKYLIIRHIRQESEVVKKISKGILFMAYFTGFLFIVGMVFLVSLFFRFPIEIPEPFRLGRSKLS